MPAAPAGTVRAAGGPRRRDVRFVQAGPGAVSFWSTHAYVLTDRNRGVRHGAGPGLLPPARPGDPGGGRRGAARRGDDSQRTPRLRHRRDDPLVRPRLARGHRHPRLALAFACADPAEVDKVYAEFTDAGYTGERPPWDAFWGQRYATVADPDGNHVDLHALADA
nr:VOC family protein [Pseudofrankia sp. DC12]